MLTAYLVCLIVGGFFVTLSMFGGAEHDHDVAHVEIDADASIDTDFDADASFDAEVQADFDTDAGHIEMDSDSDMHLDSGVGWIDMFSVRALFLFTAFFGLTGTLLTWIGESQIETLIWAILLGLLIGLGGNLFIKRVGYRVVDSGLSSRDYIGHTATVSVPFEGDQRGRIKLISKGAVVQLPAYGMESADETYEAGEEVVIIRMDGNSAEVVKPT